MELTFDPAKRAATRLARGLDFADAAKVFQSRGYTVPDERAPYGEARFITTGLLGNRVVVVVWTERDLSRRIISMRYANDRERSRFDRLAP